MVWGRRGLEWILFGKCVLGKFSGRSTSLRCRYCEVGQVVGEGVICLAGGSGCSLVRGRHWCR